MKQLQMLVKCVVCGHKQLVGETSTPPHCEKCLGPVVPVRVKVKK